MDEDIHAHWKTHKKNAVFKNHSTLLQWGGLWVFYILVQCSFPFVLWPPSPSLFFAAHHLRMRFCLPVWCVFFKMFTFVFLMLYKKNMWLHNKIENIRKWKSNQRKKTKQFQKKLPGRNYIVGWLAVEADAEADVGKKGDCWLASCRGWCWGWSWEERWLLTG